MAIHRASRVDGGGPGRRRCWHRFEHRALAEDGDVERRNGDGAEDGGGLDAVRARVGLAEVAVAKPRASAGRRMVRRRNGG